MHIFCGFGFIDIVWTTFQWKIEIKTNYDGQVVLINRNWKYVLVFERNKRKTTNYFTWRKDFVFHIHIYNNFRY